MLQGKQGQAKNDTRHNAARFSRMSAQAHALKESGSGSGRNVRGCANHTLNRGCGLRDAPAAQSRAKGVCSLAARERDGCVQRSLALARFLIRTKGAQLSSLAHNRGPAQAKDGGRSLANSNKKSAREP